jgi:hypothetical protein
MNFKLPLSIVLLFLIFACTPGEDAIPLQEETPDPYAYEGFAEIDSLLLSDVDLPEILNMDYFDSTTITVFKTIADDTEGEVYFAENASRVVERVLEIINTHGADNADICFLVDKTSSMTDDNATINSSMDTIINTIEKHSNANVALAFYGDKNVDGRNWFESTDFTTDYDQIRSAWRKYMPSGGGDSPESVTDGAYKVINELSWTSVDKRIILILGDAPPLEAPLASYSVADIVTEAKNNDIISNFYPVVVGFSWGEPGPVTSDLIAGLYPNPASSYTNLVLNSSEKRNVELFSMDGTLLESFEMEAEKHQFNVEEYPAGIYLIRVSSLNGSMTDNIRFIKE